MGALTPSWRKGALAPLGAGAVTATVVFMLLWRLVRQDVDVWTGVALRFVLFFSAGCGIAGYFLARRVLQGPKVRRQEWSLVVPSAPAAPYRDGARPSVQDLVERIEAHGYQLAVTGVDLDGTFKTSIDPRTALATASIRLADARLGRAPAGVVLRLTETLGSVEARDIRRDGCEELARFVIGELDTLFPGVTYRPLGSALTPDPADELRAVLPRRPRALRG